MAQFRIKLSEIPASISAGIVIGILALFMQASFAAIIFSGELASFLPQGMGVLLVGAIIIWLIATFRSTYSGIIAMPQDSTSAILGVVAASMAATMTTASPTTIFATVIAAMIFSSVTSGALLWILGHYNLGRLVRYMPYPVIGGFLTGTGWLLSTGGLGIMLDGALGLGMLSSTTLLQWLPGAFFAVALLLMMRRTTHFLLMPTMLTGGIGLFYLSYYLLNGEIASAQENGWLLGPFPAGGLFHPVTLLALTEGDWMMVSRNVVNLGTVFVVGTIAFLLNMTGLEIVTRSNLDLQRELKTIGVSNMIAGIAGSPLGYHILGLSTVRYRLNATSRLTGMVAIAILAGALFFGAELLAVIPKMVAGGFLLYLGLDFLTEWLYDARNRLSTLDYLLIWLILITIIFFGMLQGVIVGILVSALLFVYSYTTTKTVRHTLSRENFQSYVMRPPVHEELLRERGKSLAIFELQGFIFFGSAHTLAEQFRARIEESQPSELRFLLLDFRLVTGIDSSASLSFARLKQVIDQANIVLILTNLATPLQRQLHASILNEENNARTLIFDELDQGVAWAEELIIANVESSLPGSSDEDGALSPQPQTFLQYFEEALTPAGNAGQIGTEPNTKWAEQRALAFMEKVVVERGTVLLQEGQPVESVYFIEEGKIVIYIDHADGRRQQLRIQEAGTVFGEIGIYSGQMATATVAAKEAATLYSLSAEKFTQMEAQDPGLAIATHRLIANTLGRKLTQANYAIVALQK